MTKKNENSRQVSLEVPFYITTNLLPQFRHAQSILTRLKCFDTATLPVRQAGVAAHLQRHAMEHLHWMATIINANRDCIDSKELFYESGTSRQVSVVDLARRDELALMRRGQVPLVMMLTCIG